MPSPPGKTPPVENEPDSSNGTLLESLRRHKLMTVLLALLSVSHVWTQLILDSDVYQSLKAIKPVDKILQGLEWLLQGTIPTPVPLMVTLIACSAWAVTALFKRNKRLKGLLDESEDKRAAVIDSFEKHAKEMAEATQDIHTTTAPIAGEMERIGEMCAKLQQDHEKEIAALTSRLELLSPSDLSEDDLKILTIIAQGDDYTSVDLVMEKTKLKLERVRYHIDRLIKKKLVQTAQGPNFQEARLGMVTYLFLTPAGREFAFNSKIL